jgi:hypothetical protein
MLTKMNIALAAALVVATNSAALAQSSKPNPANRHSGYGDWAGTPMEYQTTPQQLRGRNASLPTRKTGGQGWFDWFELNRSDRASSPYGAGGG